MENFKKYLTKKNLLIVSGLITIVTALVLLSQSNSSKVELSNNGWKLKTAKDEKKLENRNNVPKEVGSTKIKLMVDVKGEVMSPGIYQFNDGDRVADIIAKAGGFTVNADCKFINLAAIVQDTMVIYIPKMGELVDSNSYMNGSPLIGDINNSSNEDKKININTATANEFETLTGIGPSRAEAIIQKRKELGKFQQIEDLMQVTGIGEKMFKKIKDSIVVK